MMTDARRVLVVSAHPDDEVFGCGGTILRHRAAGDLVAWVIATKAHEPRWSREVQERKSAEIDAAARAYDVAEVFRLGLPTGRLDAMPLEEITEAMRPAFTKIRPDTVYVVHPGDVHTDHGAVFQVAWTLMRNFRAASDGPRRVLMHETLSSTDGAPALAGRAFTPNAFSDISDWIERKLEIAALYATEMHPDPLPRSPSAIRALARYRGATIGVPYAEAFMLLRDIF